MSQVNQGQYIENADKSNSTEERFEDKVNENKSENVEESFEPVYVDRAWLRSI